MPLNREEFLRLAAGGVATGLLASTAPVRAATKSMVRAIAFDAFPIFDPRPIFALAETLFPEKGADLSNLWRTRQFEYTWLRSMSHHYADFWQVTEDALVFAANIMSWSAQGSRTLEALNMVELNAQWQQLFAAW